MQVVIVQVVQVEQLVAVVKIVMTVNMILQHMDQSAAILLGMNMELIVLH